MRDRYLPYARQSVDEKDIEKVAAVLRGDWLTTGPNVEEFEDQFKKYIKSKYSVASSTGTSALDIAVQSLNLNKGEIITTPFTFAASTNCILFNGLLPVYADIKPDTFNIDPNYIRSKINKKTKAIIYVDYAGQPCEIQEIKEIADEHDLYLIEDAAHALGAEYKKQKIGIFADITTFSFHPVKHITTGEGGMCTTNHEELSEKMKMLRNHGIDKDVKSRHGNNAGYEYDIKYLARNYRLTDFQSALGISQLKKINKSITKRNEIANKYEKLFSNIEGLNIPIIKNNIRHAWHLYPILFKKGKRDKIFSYMRRKNIGVNVHYIPTYHFTYHKEVLTVNPQDYPITEDIFSRVMSIPMFPNVTDDDIDYVCATIKDAILNS